MFVSDDVNYISDGQYLICDNWYSEYETTGIDSYIVKMTDAVFTEIVSHVRSAIYDGHIYTNKLTLSDLNGRSITLNFGFNGIVYTDDLGHPIVVFCCPRTIFRVEYATIVRKDLCGLDILPCDGKGVPYKNRSRSAPNPFTPRCNEVFRVIFDNPGISTVDLIAKLGWDDRMVTARLSELSSGGRVRAIGRHINPDTNRAISEWKAVDDS